MSPFLVGCFESARGGVRGKGNTKCWPILDGARGGARGKTSEAQSILVKRFIAEVEATADNSDE